MTSLAAIGHGIAQLGNNTVFFQEKENLPLNFPSTLDPSKSLNDNSVDTLHVSNFVNDKSINTSDLLNSLNEQSTSNIGTLSQNEGIENAQILTTFRLFTNLLLLPIKLKINWLHKQIHRFLTLCGIHFSDKKLTKLFKRFHMNFDCVTSHIVKLQKTSVESNKTYFKVTKKHLKEVGIKQWRYAAEG